MTKRQKQARRMAVPRPTPEQRREAREQWLLAELERVGWRIERREPVKMFLAKAS